MTRLGGVEKGGPCLPGLSRCRPSPGDQAVSGADYHRGADASDAEQLLRELLGQADAAVRGRTAGKMPGVKRDAETVDALHERHRGVVILARVVHRLLLENLEDAGR